MARRVPLEGLLVEWEERALDLVALDEALVELSGSGLGASIGVVEHEDGVIIIIGSTPGDVGFLLLSLSNQPTVIPGLFSLEIGNGLQSLFSIGTVLVPEQGPIEVGFPSLPGQEQPYDLFLEAVFIDPLTLLYPLADSNAQQVTVQ